MHRASSPAAVARSALPWVWITPFGAPRLPEVHWFLLHLTASGASWINLVERWFAQLTDKQLRRGSHRSTSELGRAIREYLAICNEHPKPFVWTRPPIRSS